MREKVLAERHFLSEPTAAVLFLAAWVYGSYAPLLAENIDSSKGEAAAAKVIAGAQREPPLIPDEWRTVQSAHFTIYYCRDADLKAIIRKLHKRRFYADSDSGESSLTRPEEKMAYRIDALFLKVKEMLDMYPLTMKGLKIKIFRDREELNNEYYKIFMQRADLKSFYIHKYRTIYTCETDISDSVIAHELGHAVCDHYFLVIPPEKVREMLASYVDAHLEE